MGVLSKADKKELKTLKAKKAAGSLEGGDKSRLKELKALLKSLKAAKNASDASGSAEERKSNDGDDDADKKKKKKRKRDAPESSTSSTSSTASASSASPASAKKVAPGDTAADAAYRESHGIAAGIAAGDTDARPLPPCLRSFAATPFDARIKAALTGAGYADPTPIQAQGWSVALSGDDMIAVAKTGSGKTVAFLLPVFHGLLAARAASASPSHGSAAAGPGALVIAPTRELASQIHVECERFGACLGLRSVCLYGGTNVAEQKALLRRGASMPDVVVGTPGRLVDLMEQKALVLSPQCAYVVLDEADRMLDMGFEPQIKAIFDALPSERQTLMFSATFDKGMRKLAGKYLRDSDKVATLFVESGENAELKANMSVSQRIIKVTDDEKDAKLMEVLNGLEANCRVICFANTKRRVDYLAKNLWTQGWGNSAMHGDIPQKDREHALKTFATGEIQMLCATDVAARGLDIKGVTTVINFDMARDVESYVHRIGRTGRAGLTGESITFWNPDYDKECAPALCKIARDAKQDVPAFLSKFEKSKVSKANKGWNVTNIKSAMESVAESVTTSTRKPWEKTAA